MLAPAHKNKTRSAITTDMIIADMMLLHARQQYQMRCQDLCNAKGLRVPETHPEVKDGGRGVLAVIQLSRVDGIDDGTSVLQLEARTHTIPAKYSSTLVICCKPDKSSETRSYGCLASNMCSTHIQRHSCSPATGPSSVDQPGIRAMLVHLLC